MRTTKLYIKDDFLLKKKKKVIHLLLPENYQAESIHSHLRILT